MMQVAIKEPYMLIIQDDDVFPDPRRDYFNFGTMICFHRRHDLGDIHEYKSNDDFLKDLYLKSVGNDDQGEEKYNHLLDKLSKQFDTPFGAIEYARSVNKALMTEIEKEHVVLPVYLYEHSGLAISTDSFVGRAVHAEWDSGQVGWIYVSKSDIKEAYKVDRVTRSIKEKVRNDLRDEVKLYDNYLRGECYGYELYKDGELINSCWGFVGNLNEASKDIADDLPDECKDMINNLSEIDDTASMIKTLLKHAQIQVKQAAKDMEHNPIEKDISPEL